MPSAGFWNRSWSIFKRVCAFPLIVLVRFYQLCISPFTPPSCRFTPTCSQYALEALRKYGPLKGLGSPCGGCPNAIRGAAAATIPCPDDTRKKKDGRLKSRPPPFIKLLRHFTSLNSFFFDDKDCTLF